MSVIEGGVSGSLQGVGQETGSAAHVTIKGIPHGTLGHYAFAVRINSTDAQAANSRILELRNSHATNLIIPTRLTVKAIQTAAGTAQENSLDLFKVTGFTAVDTTNTVTPTSSVKRGTMGAFPGNAVPRHLTLAGAAAGMTGGTLTKDGNALATFPFLVNTAAPTTANAYWGPQEMISWFDGIHPIVLTQNEGIILENRVLNVTSYGITWYIDLEWVECTAY